MATIKSYTSLEQSKVLAEILPIESADMYYFDVRGFPHCIPVCKQDDFTLRDTDIPCWSLTALLEIIRNNGRYELEMWEGGYCLETNGFMTESYFNPIDACYEMILNLNENKML